MRVQPKPRRIACRAAVVAAALSAVCGGLTILPSAARADTQPSGPDVASYQHPSGACIDWAAVAAGSSDGTVPPRQFAFVKATEGTSYTNPYFATCAGDATRGDWPAIRAAGLVRGTYHFARPALPMSTAVNQANYFVKAIGALNETGDLPPVLDFEVTGGLGAGDLVTWAQTWLDTVRRATGRVPIVYSYPYFLRTALGGSTAFARYPLWLADYNGGSAPATPLPGGWSSWTAWQYSSNVKQPGIPGGGVDMSRFNGDSTALASLADGTQPAQWQVVPPSAPVGVHAVPGSGSATVSWVPGDNGGELPSSYVVTASNGATATVDGAATSGTVTGLVNGMSYTFTVHAVNSAGAGAESAASNAVTPRIPTDVLSAVSPATVIYGRGSTMSATLVRTDTNERLPDRTLSVFSRPHGATAWSHVTDATTDSHGIARWTFRPTATTDVMMRWTAPRGWQSQRTFVRTVTVRPIPTQLTSSLSRRALVYGARTQMNATIVRTDTHRPLARRTVLAYHRNHGTTRWAKPVAVQTDATGTARWPFRPRVTTDVMMRWNAPRGWQPQQSFVRTVTVKPVPTRLAVTLSRHAVAYGQPVTVRASLARTDRHRALTHQQLAVYTRTHGDPAAGWQQVATMTTDAVGQAEWSFTPRLNTEVLVRWAAPRGWQPQAVPGGTVGVRRIVAAQLPTSLTNGQQAVGTGSVTPAAEGVAVQWQVRDASGWHVVATATTAPDGSFRLAWTPSAAGDVRERAFVPFQAPYAAGASRPVDARVD